VSDVLTAADLERVLEVFEQKVTALVQWREQVLAAVVEVFELTPPTWGEPSPLNLGRATGWTLCHDEVKRVLADAVFVPEEENRPREERGKKGMTDE
jgi:hypothetical protein